MGSERATTDQPRPLDLSSEGRGQRPGSGSLRVAIVDGDVSYPATSGKRLRTLHLMLALARRHQLTYLARGEGDAAANARAKAFLAEHSITAHIIDDPLPRKHGLGFALRLAANLASALPYSVASHQRPRFQQALREYARLHPVDLWQVEWSGYLGMIEGHPAPVVLQAPNIESLIWQRYYESARGRLRRWYLFQQWQKYERYERRYLGRATRVVTVTQEDAALARSRFGAQRVDVVENGVEVAEFQDLRPTGADRSILYLGSLDWRPNLDALVQLLDEILPTVRSIIPGSRLIIVGRRPPDWLRQRVAETEGVELYPDVPDVRPYLAASRVLAVPLRIGGGSRLKILEALAAGLPVVSSRVGAEGLRLQPGRDFTLADTPAEMAAALTRILQDPAEALAQAERGRQTVTASYDWKVQADRLEEVWRNAVAVTR